MEQINTLNTTDNPTSGYIYAQIFERDYALFRDCSLENCGQGIKSYKHISSGKGLYIHGDVGRGKTYLALSCLKSWLLNGYTGYIFTASDILDRCRYFIGKKDDYGMDIYLQVVKDFPLLIIDDLGVQNNTSWTDEKLFDIINARYLKQQERITIVTSNYKPSELICRFHSEVMGKRIVDRLKGMCETIELTGPSRRI